MHDRTRDGRGFRMLTILDEYSRECLAIDVSRKLTHDAVLHRLTDLFFRRGIPEHIRSDNGSEFTAKAVRTWLNRLGVRTLYIEPGSPWENGYIESFNGKLRDELLNREVLTRYSRRKCLWNDGGGNTIIYDRIVHWGIALLPQRSLCRWERRCSVSLRFTSHLRL